VADVRVLYVAMKFDYGDPSRGPGFEHWNFFDALARMGHDIVYFDFMTLLDRLGQDGMNRRLVEVARAEKPDVAFFVLFKEEFLPERLRELRDVCPTVNWFCDDHWRFDDFSRRWAPFFDCAVTTAASAVPRYAAAGIDNVVRSQWACNHWLYRRLPDAVPCRDVTFVGQPHGDRPRVIKALRRAGIAVETWGHGWPGGRLGQDAMIRVFNESRINLNLSNASVVGAGGLLGLRRLASSARAAWRAGEADPASRAAGAFAAARAAAASSAEAGRRAREEQIKGRNFEIPGCGGFVLSGEVCGIEEYYTPGSEVVTFRNTRGLIEKIRHYLSHEAERAAIAEAGRRRTLAEHTYAHRFAAIFSHMRLSHASMVGSHPGGAGGGSVTEVER
jgi:spore maturation protein CgeB